MEDEGGEEIDSAVLDTVPGVPPVPQWSHSSPTFSHRAGSDFATDSAAAAAAVAAAQHDAAFVAAAAMRRGLPSPELSETPVIEDATRLSFHGCAHSTSFPLQSLTGSTGALPRGLHWRSRE